MYDVSTVLKCDNKHEKYRKLCSNVYSLTHQQLDPTIGTNSEAAPAAESKHYSMLFFSSIIKMPHMRYIPLKSIYVFKS